MLYFVSSTYIGLFLQHVSLGISLVLMSMTMKQNKTSLSYWL